MIVSLRPVADADLDTLFHQQRDVEANRMAAFGAADPDDRAAFDARWESIRSNPEGVVRTIEVDGRLAGSIMRWHDPTLDAPEISYWLGREYWGRGIATAALSQFLGLLPDRRLYGRAVSTNAASVRVLEKAGFRKLRVDEGVIATNGRVVDEVVLRLDR